MESDRLILRRFEAGDAEAFSEYRSDPEVARYQSWDIPFPPPQAIEFIHAMDRTRPGTPGAWYQIALEHRASGRLIGDCAFVRPAGTPREAEIGFTIARSFQGRGYATEAVRRLLAFLFQEFDLDRVRGITDVENAGSVRVLEKVGMRREGHFVDRLWLKGRWSSEYEYALSRGEWESAGGPG